MKQPIQAPDSPGIYSDVPIGVYHAGPGLSSSGIKRLLRSPLHYRNPPAREEPTPALLVGNATHVKVLEPELFDSMYAMRPPGIDRRTKVGKAAWAEFQLEHAGKEVLTEAQLQMVDAMAASVLAHPATRVLLREGKREQSVYWRDEQTGVLCKARPDFLMEDGTIIDLKTCIDARLEAFQRAAFNLDYHLSADFYQHGVEQVLGVTGKPFVWLCVEKEAPHAVAAYLLESKQAMLGRNEWRRGLDIYTEAKANNAWPGYPTDLAPLGLPAWAERKLED
jgi:hypothetical protein